MQQATAALHHHPSLPFSKFDTIVRDIFVVCQISVLSPFINIGRRNRQTHSIARNGRSLLVQILEESRRPCSTATVYRPVARESKQKKDGLGTTLFTSPYTSIPRSSQFQTTAFEISANTPLTTCTQTFRPRSSKCHASRILCCDTTAAQDIESPRRDRLDEQQSPCTSTYARRPSRNSQDEPPFYLTSRAVWHRRTAADRNDERLPGVRASQPICDHGSAGEPHRLHGRARWWNSKDHRQTVV